MQKYSSLKKFSYHPIANTTKAFHSCLLVAFCLLFVSTPLWSFYNKETFDKTEMWYQFEPEEEFTLEGSENLVKDASKAQYYENVALSLELSELSKNSLGASFSWDRRGSHYVDLVPSGEKKLVSSVLEKAFMWVWGGNHLHEIGLVFVRPKDKMSYTASFGALDFYGWKQLEAGIPGLVSRTYQDYDIDKVYRLDRIRIYSNPRDKVNNIYVFLDNLKVRAYLDQKLFDGADLTKIIRKEISGAQTNKAADGEENAQTGADKEATPPADN